jgi:hypothetical protein
VRPGQGDSPMSIGRFFLPKFCGVGIVVWQQHANIFAEGIWLNPKTNKEGTSRLHNCRPANQPANRRKYVTIKPHARLTMTATTKLLFPKRGTSTSYPPPHFGCHRFGKLPCLQSTFSVIVFHLRVKSFYFPHLIHSSKGGCVFVFLL